MMAGGWGWGSLGKMGSLKKSTHPKHLNTGETLPPGGKDFNLPRIINEFILKVFFKHAVPDRMACGHFLASLERL